MIEEKGQPMKDVRQKSFILKKAEKLAQAVYRVTDVLNERDNLKWEVRTVSVIVLSDILSFIGKRDALFADKRTLMGNIIKTCSLLEVAHGGTLLPHTNFLILKKEYEDLEHLIANINDEKETERPFLITEGDLMSGEKILSSLEDNDIKDIQYKGHDMSFISLQERPLYSGYQPKDSKYLPKRLPTKLSRNRYIHDKRQANSPTGPNTERQEAIVNLIKDKKDVTIKDILGVPSIVKSSSEKTIQRELLRLVALGVLEKHGERRWSRYSLPK